MMSESSYSGSASEAEEDPIQDVGEELDNKKDENAAEGEAIKRIIPRRPKLDAERILDNPIGIQRVMEDFPKIQFKQNNEVGNLDLLISHFNIWASKLYPYGQNLLDFARTCESELYPERHRRRVFDLRVKYMRDRGAFGGETSEGMDVEKDSPEAAEAERFLAEKMEQNRIKALERRRLRESQEPESTVV